MTYDADFYKDEVASAEQIYNSLALAAVAEGHTPTWEEGVALHQAYMDLQLARKSLALFEATVASGVDNPA